MIPTVIFFSANSIGAAVLPIGIEDTQALLEKAVPTSLLQHSVAAVLHSEPGDSVEIMAESSVMGFVYMYDPLPVPTGHQLYS